MYSESQQKAFDTVKNGRNLFLTGKAGTGKSFIAKEIIKEVSKNKNVIVTAPTGIAASNIDGATIHSTFSLPVFEVISFKNASFLKTNKRDVLKKMDVLVIDEVSMLRADMLDGINYTLLKNGCKGLKDIQVIFIGDMKQIKPVIQDNFKTMMLNIYDGFDFTYSKIYKELYLHKIELIEMQRQNDIEFIENLNLIREGEKAPYFKKFLNLEKKGVIIAPHNATVKRYNQKGLDSLDGEEIIYETSIIGSVKPSDFNVEDKLILKDGCKVMYLSNSTHNPLRNGTLGIYKKKDNKDYIIVDGCEFFVERQKFVKKEYVFNEKTKQIELKETGSITQFPLKLAYAISIHKSQGMTFDECTIDLSLPCFEEGQLYVALSRVKSPNGLSIIKK